MSEQDTNETGEINNTQMSNDWRDHIPEYAKDWEEVKNSDSSEKFFSQMDGMRKLLGQSIRVPGEDAGEEQMAAFHDKLKRKVPSLMETPDYSSEESMNDVLEKMGASTDKSAYELEGIDDETLVADLQELAADSRLTKAQFKKVSKKLIDKAVAEKDARGDALAKEKSNLEKEWGAALSQRTDVALAVAENTGAPPAVLDQIKSGQMDANSMKWLYGLSKQLGGEISVLSRQQDSVITPVQAKETIIEIMNNRSHPYWDNSHPGHKKAVDRMLELRRASM